MNFKTSLDKYLTSEPQDDFTPYVEAVYDSYNMPDDAESLGMFENSYLENELLGILYDNLYLPDEAAKLLHKWLVEAILKSVSFGKSPKTDFFIKIKAQLLA